MWHIDPYSYGYAHGMEDRKKKQRYRPEIFLSGDELTEYKKGYRDGRRPKQEEIIYDEAK